VTLASRLAVGLVAALTVITLVLHATVVRPRLYPAGAGLTISGDTVLNELSAQPPVGLAHLPDPRGVVLQPARITAIWPGGEADRAGLRPGTIVTGIDDADAEHVAIGDTFPSETRDILALWARMYRIPPTGPLTLTVVDAPGSAPRTVVLARPAVWRLGSDTLSEWFWQFHGAPLAKHLVYTLAALLIVALGARGFTATLLTIAFLIMAGSDDGPLMGAEWMVPGLGPALLVFGWLLLPVAFPTISMAILYFPSRAPLLDRHPWIAAAVWVVSVPLATISSVTVAYLLGAGAAAPAVTWFAANPWLFDTCVSIGLGTNLVLVLHAVQRYRNNPDALERRRIETVLVTAVPGMVAYMLATAVPLVASNMGMAFRWTPAIARGLEVIVLISAFGMAYSVAVRRALSPRTFLRQSLHYALARKTLGILTALPALLLIVALVTERDQPLSAIVRGRPLFYIAMLILIAAGLRYRDAARRWLDRRFFRSEYDAKEILLSLASRVPQETDPRALISLVLSDVETALHPASIAVLAENGGWYEVAEARSRLPERVPASSGLVQLLQWSDQPLEVFLDDPQSTVGRLPAADRDWLRDAGAALAIPVFAGTSVERPLVGFIVLGPKRSEESFTREDRQLLAGIAAQMGLALDLSRLRRQAAATPRAFGSPVPEAATGVLPVAIDVGAVIDGKYRVEALIGRGGMGAVYRARDTRLDRDVAVKVVRGELVSSIEARERFKREAQLAARLQHPSIVTVFDYGTLADGAAYLVMEYVKGEDLRARLVRGLPDRPDAARMLAAIAEGVDAAHREQVLHRDLKPENVVLPENGGPPKVTDFGVAKLMASPGAHGTVTNGATIVGTPAYMAPEQLRGGPVDARTDVYSLGVLGYELFTGHVPFGAGSLVDVATRQGDDPPLEASGVPDQLAGLLRRALSFDPAKRPRTAMAFATELRRAVGD
jgi:GAF domain-containing protein/predicted Ser/Thr protein kinase